MKEYLEVTKSGKIKIHWSKVPGHMITQKQYKRLYNYLENNCYRTTVQKGEKTSSNPFNVYEDKVIWTHDICRGYHTLYIRKKDYSLVRYWWKPNCSIDNGYKRAVGRRAVSTVNERFKEQNGVTMRVAFGCIDDPVLQKRVENLVMMPVSYCNNRSLYKTIDHVYKSDISSAYDYALTKKLPDFHDARFIHGYEKPNEEYPFAFYLDTHHIEIYNEYSTYKIRISDLYNKILDYKRENLRKPSSRFVNCEEKHTILMKASQYTLKDVLEQLYEERKDDPDTKQIMVAFTGRLHSLKYEGTTEYRKGQYFGHLAAVMFVYHWKYMIDLYNEINNGKNVLLQIQTDCCIWSGSQIKSSADEKTLGCFHKEYEDCKFRQKSLGVYAFEDKDGNIFGFKHQATKVPEQFELNNLEDIDNIKETIEIVSGEGKVCHA